MNRQWVRTFGPTSGITNPDRARDLAISHAGEVYVVGTTTTPLGAGSRPGGATDGYLVKYDPSGKRQWTRLIGTGRRDDAYGVEASGVGVTRIHVVGETEGSLDGRKNGSASGDGFVSTYADHGERLWTRLTGAKAGAVAVDVADDAGRIFVTGHSTGDIAGKSAPNGAGFITSYRRSAPPQRNWLHTFGKGTKMGRKLGTISGVDSITAGDPDTPGQLYVTGTTGPTRTGAPNSDDAFVVSFNDSPA
ncbi:MAG: hypothetical protein ABEK29_06675, partial [Bradymonadaceae bacterium]